jgi:hypothetical protein
MSKRLPILIVAIICTFVGGGIGYLTGAARSGVMMTDYLLDSNSSWLSQHIARLAMIRTGHADDSAADIEKSLDNSIEQLSWSGLDKSGGFHPKQLPEMHLRALQIAKVYADAGYREAFSKDSLHILDQVQPIEEKYCLAALRELQEQASK